MQNVRTISVVLVVLAVLSALRAEPTSDVTKSAAIGDAVAFVDEIQEVVVKPSGTVFLNFGGKYPNETLTVIVMEETRERFPEVEKWIGRKVRVSGELSDYKGHRRIILRERDQIALVGE